MTERERTYWSGWASDRASLAATAASLRVIGPSEPVRGDPHVEPRVEPVPGAWMPSGRAPHDLIPEPEESSFVFVAHPQRAERSHIGDGQALRRWHRLRKAGLA